MMMMMMMCRFLYLTRKWLFHKCIAFLMQLWVDYSEFFVFTILLSYLEFNSLGFGYLMEELIKVTVVVI